MNEAHIRRRVAGAIIGRVTQRIRLIGRRRLRHGAEDYVLPIQDSLTAATFVRLGRVA